MTITIAVDQPKKTPDGCGAKSVYTYSDNQSALASEELARINQVFGHRSKDDVQIYYQFTRGFPDDIKRLHDGAFCALTDPLGIIATGWGEVLL